MWWISYRGESGHGVDNIGVFEDDGSPRKKHPLLLDPSPAAHPLHIARGFALVGDDLYIANAWRKDSHIARYRRHGDTFRFQEVLVKTAQIAAMVHPFDVELGDDGRIYISCQDTNLVVALVAEAAQTRIRGRPSSQAISQGEVSPRHARRILPRQPPGVWRAHLVRCAGASRPEGGAGQARQATPLGARHRRAQEKFVCGGRGRRRGEGLQCAFRRIDSPRHGTASSRRPCTCSCTARRCISARRAPAASWHSI